MNRRVPLGGKVSAPRGGTRREGLIDSASTTLCWQPPTLSRLYLQSRDAQASPPERWKCEVDNGRSTLPARRSHVSAIPIAGTASREYVPCFLSRSAYPSSSSRSP